MVGAAHEHEVALHGAWGTGRNPGAVIVECRDEDFLPALFAKLSQGDPARVVAERRPKAGAAPLRLFQPVHRVFNVVLAEAHCETFGEPRLDPAKIESAGMVVRRVSLDKKGRRTHEGWLATEHGAAAWQPLTAAEQKRDPEPLRRARLRLTNNPEFDAEELRLTPEPAEHFASMFPAPPALTAKLGRTLLHGVLPVTSSARSGAAPEPAEFDRTQWVSHLCRFLRAGTNAAPIRFPGGKITAASMDVPLAMPDDKSTPPISPLEALNAARFVLLLRQLVQEFRILRPPAVNAADAVIAELNKLTVALSGGGTAKAGNYARTAGAVLFEDDAGAPYFDDGKLPTEIAAPTGWPTLDEKAAGSLVDALIALSNKVREAVVAPAGSHGRFDEPGAHYFVRAFVRVKCADGCPPKLVWSEPGEDFEIAEWFASGPQPPPVVVLPDPFDKNFLKAAKPGVTFSIPPSLANFLNQDPKKILAGNATKGGGISIGFLCGFSIPIITICAIILLSIILSLLNFIFHWIPFVKVCIPIPKPR